VAVHLEHPESVAGPPVVAVSIKDHRLVLPYPLIADEPPEGIFVDVVTHHLML
jgi:hypothetical protein